MGTIAGSAAASLRSVSSLPPTASTGPDPWELVGIDLNELLIHHPATTFLLRVRGDSMLGAGIRPGDLLVVDRQIEPRSGHIVVARVEGAFTLKRLVRRGTHWWLEAANPAYPALPFAPAPGQRTGLAERPDPGSHDAGSHDPVDSSWGSSLWGVAVHTIRSL